MIITPDPLLVWLQDFVENRRSLPQLRAKKYFTLILWTAALSFEMLDKDPQTVAALFFTLSRKPQTQKLSTLHEYPPAFQICWTTVWEDTGSSTSLKSEGGGTFLTICFTLWPHRHLSQQMRGCTWLENFSKKFCHQKNPPVTAPGTRLTQPGRFQRKRNQILLEEDSSIFLMDLP